MFANYLFPIFDLLMSKTITYIISKLPLDVRFANKVTSIDFTPYTQKETLSRLYQESATIVIKIKTDYRNHYQKELKIKNASFIAEIWGHLAAYRLALWMQRNIKLWPVQKLAKFVAFRSGVIDCGEGSIDTNRWFWDILARLFFSKYK